MKQGGTRYDQVGSPSFRVSSSERNARPQAKNEGVTDALAGSVGSQSGCHTGSISIVLKVIHDPSTDATSGRDKAVSGGRPPYIGAGGDCFSRLLNRYGTPVEFRSSIRRCASGGNARDRHSSLSHSRQESPIPTRATSRSKPSA